MPRRRNYWDDESNGMGLESLVTGRRRAGMSRGGGWGTGARSPGRGTRFFQPDQALASQPFFGFPGGQEAWEDFRTTGQLPFNPGTGRAVGLTPEVRDFYYKNPMVPEMSPITNGNFTPSPFEPVYDSPNTTLPYQPGGEAITAAQQGVPDFYSQAPPPNTTVPYQPGGQAITAAQQGRPTVGALERLVAPPPRPAWGGLGRAAR